MASQRALSPRISFSHDIDLSDLPAAAAAAAASPSLVIDDEFDFSVSLDALSIQDPSPADQLFSHGKLLPLSSLNPAHPQEPEKPKPKPDKNTKQTTLLRLSAQTSSSSSSSSSTPIASTSTSTSSSSSFWNSTIGRSSSVGAATGSKSKLSSICPFPRSKSTGSFPTKRQQVVNNTTSYSNINNGYYYNSAGRGKLGRRASCSAAATVRISPVINVGPTHFIPRGGTGTGRSGSGVNTSSFFAYLLCSCRGKNCQELV